MYTLLDLSPETSKPKAKRVHIISIKMIKESSYLYGRRRIKDDEDAYELVKKYFEGMDREVMLLACLDTKNQPIAVHVVSIGSLNSSIIHPREILKAAILSNASSIMLFHNHPSGNIKPSPEDLASTARLQEAAQIIGIPLLDHIIIGDDTYLSMRRKNII